MPGVLPRGAQRRDLPRRPLCVKEQKNKKILGYGRKFLKGKKVTMPPWRECLIQAEGIRKGELFQFKDLCVKAFQLGKFPKSAAVFSEAAFGSDQVKFWVSPLAAQLLEKNGVDLS